MNTTLLVLLVGEMLSPFPAELKQALPRAFPGAVPEIGIGPSAPPGRNVAWLSLSPDGQQLDIVLHTARVPGDLRRTLRFGSDDSMTDRARAAAFTLAAMVRQRDEDLRALQPQAPPPLEAGPPRRWTFDLSGFFALDVPAANAGGGGSVRLRRELSPLLSLGALVDVGATTAPSSALVVPSLAAELALGTRGEHLGGAFVVGGGVSAPVLIRDGVALTTWLPLVRVALEGRLWLGPQHGLRAAVAGHFVPFRLAVQAGDQVLGLVGPAWIRPEIGYFVEL